MQFCTCGSKAAGCEKGMVIKMKKWIKGCIIAALVCILVGVLVLMAAVATGGTAKLEEMVRSGTMCIGSNNIHVGWWSDGLDDAVDESLDNIDENIDERMDSIEKHVNQIDDMTADWDEGWDVWQKDATSIKKETVSLGEQSSGIRNLDFEIRGGSLMILPTTESEIRIENNSSIETKYKIEGDTLSIRDGGRKYRIGHFNDRRVVYLPEDMVFDKVLCRIGGGLMQVKDIRTGDASLQIGGGEVDVDGITCNKLYGSIGAGELNFDHAAVQDGNFAVGVGALDYSGSIGDKLTADCSMGEADFHLTGGESDFNYKVSIAAGDVTIGSQSFSGIGVDRTIDNQAEKSMELNCAMGSLSVDFEE